MGPRRFFREVKIARGRAPELHLTGESRERED
jgi:hypothetical protein